MKRINWWNVLVPTVAVLNIGGSILTFSSTGSLSFNKFIVSATCVLVLLIYTLQKITGTRKGEEIDDFMSPYHLMSAAVFINAGHSLYLLLEGTKWGLYDVVVTVSGIILLLIFIYIAVIGWLEEDSEMEDNA